MSYQSSTSSVPLVKPQAICSLYPATTSGAGGKATPRTLMPGAESCTSYQTAGRESSRCMSLQRMGKPSRVSLPLTAQLLLPRPGPVRYPGDSEFPRVRCVRRIVSGGRRLGAGSIFALSARFRSPGRRPGDRRKVERSPGRDDRVDERRENGKELIEALIPSAAPALHPGHGGVLIEGGQREGHGLEKQGALEIRPRLRHIIQDLVFDGQALAAEVFDAGVDAGRERVQGLPSSWDRRGRSAAPFPRPRADRSGA